VKLAHEWGLGFSPSQSLVGYNWRFQLQLVKTKPKMDGSDFWNWF